MKEIVEGKSIANALKESSDNAKKILTAMISSNCSGIYQELALMHFVIYHKNDKLSMIF
ncbi:hypothetical protein [Wolbachia pipientis]|uniref:hypothetical protein n=1 Tax=Wolbachia pipientis TaxID=955 RepID=UPI0025A36093|nr:hypothetical protein [Wolbachia pipientis]MDM8335512.1 hypothetical protein [Wolbachia pipientis]